MEHLLNDDEFEPRQRELTLSSAAIFGIFFGIVLSWGLFFALGFNMGSHKTAPAAASSEGEDPSGATANFSGFKPAAGSPAGGSTSQPAPAAPVNSSLPTAVAPASRTAAPAAASASDPAAAERPAAAPRQAAPEPVSSTSTAPAATVTGASFVVQVAAVSHQEDADLLVSALKAKGYAVAARTEGQDKWVHIQVGPFNSRKDADAMRQRLLADGYNAIVK